MERKLFWTIQTDSKGRDFAVTMGMANQEGTGALSIFVDEDTIEILKSSGDRISDLRGGNSMNTNNSNCDICNGIGWINSNNENWESETQKCDTCQVYKTDTEAQKAKVEGINEVTA